MTSKENAPVYIAVMGVTGAGKSRFIQLATDNKDIVVGHELRSCTSEVGTYPFNHGGRRIILIDTPGFNDTTRSETEVLKEIADWLAMTDGKTLRIKLSGIIYLQSIDDTRMYGSTMRNLKMFRQLCGDQPLKSVILATTFWDKEDHARAVEREDQLRTDPEFWQPMLKKGSRLARVTDRDSALGIITSLVDQSPVILAIQDELINQNKKLVDTSAGKTVNEEIEKLSRIHQEEMEKIKIEMQEALAARDVELQESLADAAAATERRLDRLQRDGESLRYERRSEQRRFQQELEDTRTVIERTQREREADRKEYETNLRAQKVASEMQFEAIVAKLRENQSKVRDEERIYVEEQIKLAEAEPKSSGRKTKLLINIGQVVGSVAMTALGFPMIFGNPFSGIMDIWDEIVN